MSKISTDDCKKFLINFHANNLHIEKTRFELTDESPELDLFVKELLSEKNWKRLFKRKPEYDETSIYISGVPVNIYAEPQSKVKLEDIKFVRGFEMIKSDGQIAYLVLEMKDGTLHLGDYIGD